MKAHLTERIVKAAEALTDGDLRVFDDEVIGFGLCVYASGVKAFFLRYNIAGRRRYFTIGSWPDWSAIAAREEAKALKRRVDQGSDPLARRVDAREAATGRELIDRYINEHTPKLAPRNAADQKSMLHKLVEPKWGVRKVAEISSSEVDKLLADVSTGRARPHKTKPRTKRKHKLSGTRPTPIRANRVGEVLRKMFNLAIEWKMRGDNPAARFHRNVENEREYFLTLNEIDRIASIIDSHENQRAADLIRFLLLTGARLSEVRTARFEQFNLELAIWTKRAATTKQRKTHRLPISPDAVTLVRRRRDMVPPDCPWLFPGGIDGQPVREIRRFWNDVRKAAHLPELRIHDLRHTFASLLVSGGMTLPMIGKLLGHTQAKTTQRYAHLFDDPLRAGVSAVGKLLRPKLKLVPSEPAPEAA
jgi:integrase